MADEEVIKRRLLIDGDGTGDDRRLMLLLKTYVKWFNTPNESLSDTKMIKEQLLGQLAQCEYVFEKCKISSKMNEAELKNYDTLADEIKSHIEKTKEEIQNAKSELQDAKLYRKNGIEREVIANVIEKHPERKDTEKRLAVIEKHLKQLEETKQELDNKLEIRKKHFHVLIASLHQLQSILDTEEGNYDMGEVSISDEEMDTSDL